MIAPIQNGKTSGVIRKPRSRHPPRSAATLTDKACGIPPGRTRFPPDQAEIATISGDPAVLPKTEPANEPANRASPAWSRIVRKPCAPRRSKKTWRTGNVARPRRPLPSDVRRARVPAQLPPRPGAQALLARPVSGINGRICARTAWSLVNSRSGSGRMGSNELGATSSRTLQYGSCNDDHLVECPGSSSRGPTYQRYHSPAKPRPARFQAGP
jgi:hypothetical protein